MDFIGTSLSREYVLFNVCVPSVFVRLLICIQYVPEHRYEGSLHVCVDVSSLVGHCCHFPHPLVLRPFTYGFTVLSLAYIFFIGDYIIGELVSDNYFNVSTCSTSLVASTGWVAI